MHSQEHQRNPKQQQFKYFTLEITQPIPKRSIQGNNLAPAPSKTHKPTRRDRVA